ncbi:MAG: hypothetical protein AUK34_03540 [Ignavibacteria bacterium CG2_30_36_16]|nr:MAG: hypothetical protein AUK34_03540 [Ignavibacteria bacterium CG2_30_36_16]
MINIYDQISLLIFHHIFILNKNLFYTDKQRAYHKQKFFLIAFKLTKKQFQIKILVLGETVFRKKEPIYNLTLT